MAVEIHLPEHLEKYVDDQVVAGRFATRDNLISAALEHFRRVPDAGGDPLLGLFADDPDAMDEVVEAAMRDRESRPLRLPADG